MVAESDDLANTFMATNGGSLRLEPPVSKGRLQFSTMSMADTSAVKLHETVASSTWSCTAATPPPCGTIATV